MHYKIWSDSFLLSLGFIPSLYPLLLMFLVPFLLPLHNLCKIISSRHTYDLSVFSITIVTKPFFSFFFQLLQCQPCRWWKARKNNTSMFIVVRGRTPCFHNFSFHFSCQPKCPLQWIKFPKMNLMLNAILKVPMKTSILCFSRISFTLIFNFWSPQCALPLNPFF